MKNSCPKSLILAENALIPTGVFPSHIIARTTRGTAYFDLWASVAVFYPSERSNGHPFPEGARALSIIDLPTFKVGKPVRYLIDLDDMRVVQRNVGKLLSWTTLQLEPFDSDVWLFEQYRL